MSTSYERRRELEGLDPTALENYQLERLNALLSQILPHNKFYEEKLGNIQWPLESLESVKQLPFTSKDELITGESSDVAANLTYPIERYTRMHRTSGTRGRPIVVLDTAEDWQWWIDCWQFVLDAADVGEKDRALMAFSFGPFIGFWSAYDAVAARGALVIPTGGLSTLARLELMREMNATVLLCTPTYALRMAEVAQENKIDTASIGVSKIIVAGEPGGSIPSVRDRIETSWNARLIDHSGATEVGPWGYADENQRGLHVNESEFLPEFISVETDEPSRDGELSELILTTLGRAGSPVIRYRTGDLVRPTWNSPTASNFVLLEGGVLGRTDDMMIIRGVNIFPSSVEQILRSFPDIVEYRITARKSGEMDALAIEVEDHIDDPQRIAKELQVRLGLTVEVRSVSIGSLPRFEAKGKRFIDKR